MGFDDSDPGAVPPRPTASVALPAAPTKSPPEPKPCRLGPPMPGAGRSVEAEAQAGGLVASFVSLTRSALKYTAQSAAESVRHYTAGDDTRIGELTRATVSWLTGEEAQRPFPPGHCSARAAEEPLAARDPRDLLKITTVADVRLSSFLIPRSLDQPLPCSLRLSVRSVRMVWDSDGGDGGGGDGGGSRAAQLAPLEFPYPQLAGVGMPEEYCADGPVALRFVLKDYREYTAVIPRGDVANLLYESLALMCLHATAVDALPFRWPAQHTGDEGCNSAAGPGDGGPVEARPAYAFDLEGEYRRMLEAVGGSGAEAWRVSHANDGYVLCGTYPEALLVPAAVPDSLVCQAATHRSKQRLPAVVYLHANGTFLARCSQPMRGMLGSTDDGDQGLLRAMFGTNPNPAAAHHIVDARPKLAAVANFLRGRGHEDAAEYGERFEVSFHGIGNIHAMRASLRDLVAACRDRALLRWCARAGPGALTPRARRQSAGSLVSPSSDGGATTDGGDSGATTDGRGSGGGEHHDGEAAASPLERWREQVEASQWLEHVRTLLRAAVFVAGRMVEGRESVLVHCSDGWDRSSQLTALAQILIDPHFRTLRGFVDIVEKEWLHFGHKFADRMATLGLPTDEYSPVFTQFLDCTWQVLCQYPDQFEFNTEFLRVMAAAPYSGDYATFLGNCERERSGASAPVGPSLWDTLLRPESRRRFTNPQYSPTAEYIEAQPQLRLAVWVAAYAPWLANPGPPPGHGACDSDGG